ncbi:lactate utilization protein B/C [Emticicia sp. CRIBPO]|uniref:LutC/YkgG family protein n=1 Tax=Emticicia sp. CRIBPO TaxID=2683258 RepID=UPI0014132FDF|nr:LUD domain-containing protein [Emticicia sp. CRIBPO]NBA84646.1 lactate utilization protein B/C [Emticicia sp. CRIBPO]
MSSRESILSKIKASQPEQRALPGLTGLNLQVDLVFQKYREVLTSIGGTVVEVGSFDEIKTFIMSEYNTSLRLITTLPELADIAETGWLEADPHSLSDVELTIIRGVFGVAENGAVWLTEKEMGQRVAPFICQNLAIVIQKENIVADLHLAYERIGNEENNFSTFLAGPSKTADIEQSLVLGAHGSRSLVVFVL